MSAHTTFITPTPWLASTFYPLLPHYTHSLIDFHLLSPSYPITPTPWLTSTFYPLLPHYTHSLIDFHLLPPATPLHTLPNWLPPFTPCYLITPTPWLAPSYYPLLLHYTHSLIDFHLLPHATPLHPLPDWLPCFTPCYPITPTLWLAHSYYPLLNILLPHPYWLYHATSCYPYYTTPTQIATSSTSNPGPPIHPLLDWFLQVLLPGTPFCVDSLMFTHPTTPSTPTPWITPSYQSLLLPHVDSLMFPPPPTHTHIVYTHSLTIS